MFCLTSCNSRDCDHRRTITSVSDSKSEEETWISKIFAQKKKKSESKWPKMSAFLVVMILSSPRNMAQRLTIRQTWLKDVKSDVLHLFTIGSTYLEDEEKRTLESEISRFQDILILPNVNESYEFLTKKLLHSLRWIADNVEFEFLFKCDDDTFAKIDEMSSELESLSVKSKLYWGFFDGRASVKRKGKWAEHNFVLCDRYLPYALGGGYVLSADLVQFISRNTDFWKLYQSEDVSVGVWLAGVDVRRVHDPRFDTEYVSRGCFDVYLVTHKQSVDQMREKYWLLQEKGKMCTVEQRTRLSYEYNWNVPPSQCCVRNDSKIP
ncbi:UDP-Gal betaGal beta 1,3-galactosyltransferase, polypeptide 6 [Chamberlinius hualienensis]